MSNSNEVDFVSLIFDIFLHFSFLLRSTSRTAEYFRVIAILSTFTPDFPSFDLFRSAFSVDPFNYVNKLSRLGVHRYKNSRR